MGWNCNLSLFWASLGCLLSQMGRDPGLDLSSLDSPAVLSLSAPCCLLVVTVGSMKPKQGRPGWGGGGARRGVGN